jgi:hypothetical protein
LIKWTQLAGQWKAGIILGVGLITPACFEQVSGRLLSYLDGAPPFPVCTYRSVEGFDPDGRSPLAPVFDGLCEAAILLIPSSIDKLRGVSRRSNQSYVDL